MNEKVRDLFVRVVTRKMKDLNKSVYEILSMYPKLTEAEKTEIKNCIVTE